jgi:pimeloyl-ACP methyl ester carboxylesterase
MGIVSKGFPIFAIAMILCGCVPAREIRTLSPSGPDGIAGSADTLQAGAVRTNILPAPSVLPAECNVGSPTSSETHRGIEDYGSYLLGFAEFDDQGWSYDGDRQLTQLQQRLQSDLKNPAYSEMDFVVVVFVHGWHHNAHDNDCNVQEARQMVRIASEQFVSAIRPGGFKRQRRVIGIYVGWRGESVNAAGLRYATVIDRRDAAEKVAKGSVRQLFANLHEQQLVAQAAAATDRKDPKDAAARMYTTVVGHSFGGLIVFNALSQQIISDLTAAAQTACSPGDAIGVTRPWPDSVILINPAFEATRFEPINRIADRAAACGYAAQHPLLTVITADNDHWTGSSFAAARRVLTLFEKYDDSTPQSRAIERNVNLRAIGFVARYRTHRLCLRSEGGSEHATLSATVTPESTANPQTILTRTVWVVGAPPEIVDGHNGFLYARKRGKTPQPYLLMWLVSTHVNPAAAVSAPNSCGAWH